jgi:hypothetical protein
LADGGVTPAAFRMPRDGVVATQTLEGEDNVLDSPVAARRFPAGEHTV